MERRSEDSVPPDVAEAVLTALKPKVDALRREIEFKKAEQREPYRLPYVIGKSQEFLNELSDEDLQLLQSLGQIQSSLDPDREWDDPKTALIEIANYDIDDACDPNIPEEIYTRIATMFDVAKARRLVSDIKRQEDALANPDRKYLFQRNPGLQDAFESIESICKQVEERELISIDDIDELREPILGVISIAEGILLDHKEHNDVLTAAEEYSEVLLRKFDQLTYVDDYDTLELGGFRNELKRFVGKKLSHIERVDAEELIVAIFSHVSQLKKEKEDSSRASNMTPEAYEALCAKILSQQGWSTRLTRKTGDFGVDVIAEKNGLKLVVQCKLYSSPVGNKAVQEILGAKQFEDADFAAVVSNAGFTVAARVLAQKVGVLLLHHDELKELARIAHQGVGPPASGAEDPACRAGAQSRA
jgi:restriction system protein